MLIQPFLENAIWHGLRYKQGKGKLSISVKKDNELETYIIKIRDNGIGREASAKFNASTKKSYGIKISSERLKNFNRSNVDQIQIHDIKNELGVAQGTLVEIKLKRK